MAVSAYQESWETLKNSKDGKIRVTLEAPAGCTQEVKEKLFKRYRKALSKRKDQDSFFYLENPTAKLVVARHDWETMTFDIHLTFRAGTITLADL